MMARIQGGEIQLPPAQLRLRSYPMPSPMKGPGDGILEVIYRGHEQQYIVECKNRSTLQTIQMAISQARQYADITGLAPLVFVPYLSDKALTNLENEGVSGMDLSGNGVILAPGFTIWRSGQPNRYPEIQTVKNLYRGVSTIFGRCFLLRSEFDTLKDLREYALSRLSQREWSANEAVLTMGTASKVIRQLEEELIIQRKGRALRVLDAKRLMEGLKANHRVSGEKRISGKTSLSGDEIWQRLGELESDRGKSVLPWRYSATGLGSATKYKILSGPEKLSLYVTDLDRTADLIDLRATRVFPNVELIENRGDAEYFDARGEGRGQVWASPIQTWLELATGGPREQDAVQRLASVLADSRGEQLA